jgi:hypothetical protein
MRDPEVMARRPYWLFDAVRPTPCPSEICTELDGKIFRADDPRVDVVYPPNHHGCQSGFRCIRASEAERRGGVSQEPIKAEAQEGFGLSPALSRPWMPDGDGRDSDLIGQLGAKVEAEAQAPDPLADALLKEQRAQRLKEQAAAIEREQEAARAALAARKAAKVAQAAEEARAAKVATEAEAQRVAAAAREAEERAAAEVARKAAEEAARKAQANKVWSYAEVASKRPEGGLVAPYMQRKAIPAPPSREQIVEKARKLRMKPEVDVGNLDVEGKGMLNSSRYTRAQRKRVLAHQEHGKRQFFGDPETGAAPVIQSECQEAIKQFSMGYDYTIRQMASGAKFDDMVKSRIEHVTGKLSGTLTEEELAWARPAAEDHVREAWVAAQNIEQAFRDSADALIKTTYRGIGDLDDEALDRFLGHDYFDFQGKTSSTSTSFGIASKFSMGNRDHSVIFKLHRKSKGIEITSVSLVATEDEVLLHGASRWQITKRTRLFGEEGLGQKWLIEAEEIVD